MKAAQIIKPEEDKTREKNEEKPDVSRAEKSTVVEEWKPQIRKISQIADKL